MPVGADLVSEARLSLAILEQNPRQLGVLRDEAHLFKDTTPLNEVHLGLIRLPFPEAPVRQLIPDLDEPDTKSV